MPALWTSRIITYDTKGNLLSWVTSNEEDNTYFTYNSAGKVVREQNGNDYSYYTYDSKGNNLIYATLKENYDGETPAIYDSSLTCFNTTEYTYDSKGRVTKEKDSLGSIYEYEYDAAGNVTKETLTETADGETKTTVTTYTYDSFGNVLTTGCEKDTSSYIYDKAGRTLLATENGESTRTLYDDLGRTVQEIAPEDYDSTKDGLPNENTYDPNSGHRYEYNYRNQIVKETNRFNITADYKYNGLGVIESIKFDIYEYLFDFFGQLSEIKVGGNTVARYFSSADDETGVESFGTRYANNQGYRYVKDKNAKIDYLYNINENYYNTRYFYNDNGDLIQKFSDTFDKIYKDDGEVCEEYSETKTIHKYKQTVDSDTGISALTESVENHFFEISGDDFLNEFKIGENLSFSLNNSFDDKSLTKSSYLVNDLEVLNKNYVYSSNEELTNISYSNCNGKISDFKASYGRHNKITSTENFGKTADYEYDSKGQLVRENNSQSNKTYTYTYDDRGNILTKSTYDYSQCGLNEPLSVDIYEYASDGWKDVLVKVNGKEITYDEIGNPLTIDDAALTWSYKNELIEITAGDKYIYNEYDENGFRTAKYYYYGDDGYDIKSYSYVDGRLTAEYYDDINLEEPENFIYYQYDTNNKLTGFVYENNQFFYLKNQQSDIVGITDVQGNLIAKYAYDAWENILLSETVDDTYGDIAEINPFRYRSYYYDKETNLYYLMSRYYNPQIGRFINSDAFEMPYINMQNSNSSNLFAYCNNEPLNTIDPDGFKPKLNQQPPASSGYAPPKKGAYQKKVPKGKLKGKKGWVDKKGNYWVPDPSNHGGDHWDVVDKNGKNHKNVYPDGYVRENSSDFSTILNMFTPTNDVGQLIFYSFCFAFVIIFGLIILAPATALI